MERLLKDIEKKVADCYDIQNFKGPKFHNVLRELNHIFQKGDDAVSARACQIVISQNLLEHIITLWKESSTNGNVIDGDTVNMVKALIWNCSDKHSGFAKLCATSGHLFQLLIEDMRSLNPHDLDDRLKRNGVRADLGILHNLLRHDSSALAILVEFDGLEAVRLFTDSNYRIIRIFALVVLAYAGESSSPLTDGDGTFLIKIMETARSSENHTYVEQGLTLQEILQFIFKLINGNADRKNMLIKNGLLKNLDKLLDKSEFSEDEVVACLELLWELAISDSSKEALIQQQSIVTAIDNCLEAEGTQTESVIRKECISLSFLLKPPTNPDEKKHIMISYQWDSQDIILKLYEYLEEHGFEVWLDVKRMKGSLLTSMAEAVENAAIVLLGVTEKYGESSNTRKEAQYADQKKIPIVPLMLQKEFQPSGWLGILIAGQLYCDLTEAPQHKFELVKNQIQSILPNNASQCKKR